MIDGKIVRNSGRDEGAPVFSAVPTGDLVSLGAGSSVIEGRVVGRNSSVNVFAVNVSTVRSWRMIAWRARRWASVNSIRKALQRGAPGPASPPSVVERLRMGW